MFGFLKDKLKKAKEKFSKEIEESPQETTEEVEETEEVEVKEEIKEEPKEIPKEPKKEEPKEIVNDLEELSKEIKEEPKKISFVSRIKKKITTKKISEDKFEELFYDLELGLLESNVAVEVIEKIKEGLKMDLVNVDLDRNKIDKIVENSLRNSIKELFDYEEVDLINKAKEKKPFKILFLGINGSGKTTSIAKIAKYFQSNNLSCVLGAADTFRAAAIEQLSIHGDKLNMKVIKHDYGADPAAVAFDSVKYAESKNMDVVLIDTAGRMHSNKNLMEEIKKVDRVVKPDLKVFVGESITGNDVVDQARKFNQELNIDGIILSKADVDNKGGSAISVSYVTGKPILFLGTGQEYGDLEKFNLDKLMESLGF